MTATDLAAALIRQHEGLRLTVYDDKTGDPIVAGYTVQGHPTIGYGARLDGADGITAADAETLLTERLHVAKHDAREYVGGLTWQRLNAPRQAVLIDMAYNLGAPKLGMFVQLRYALESLDFDCAASEMSDSLWARQVGERARTLAAVMVSGQMPEGSKP
jgi:lysozyme